MSDYHDVLQNVPERKVAVHGAGYVELIDVMPRLVPPPRTTADFAVCDAARTSYGDARPVSDERTLLRYLMRRGHNGPFEAVRFKLRLRAPIFVARQLHTYRIASRSEISGRYTEMPTDAFNFGRNDFRAQSATNKQGSDPEPFGKAGWCGLIANDSLDASRDTYDELLREGAARELARVVLPLATYTQWEWGFDLRNLLHMLAERCGSHAQRETRDYAEAVLKLITPVVPECVAAWDDYHPLRGAVLLTRAEAAELGRVLRTATLKAGPVSDSKRENGEWDAKLRRLLAAGEER